MPIKTICAWCQRDLSPQIVDYTPREVSHTMCDACLQQNLRDDPVSIREFLDGQEFPILLVDGDGRVLSGNDKAERKVGKPLGSLQGLLGGDVVGCVNASEPGGCGHTPRCSVCEFRQSFEHTHQTGQSLNSKPVTMTVHGDGPTQRQLLLTLSTRKVGQAVFITLHEISEQQAACVLA